MPTKSQAQRDLEALGVLARKAVEQVNLSLAGLPASQITSTRGPLAAAILTALVEGYRQERETYALPEPDIPPTPVPKPRI